MTPDALAVTAWLLASIPLLVVAASLLYAWRHRKPRRLSKAVLTREGEAWMGRHLRGYKPRRTVHSIVNRLYATPTEYKTPAAILPGRSNFSDVSFYQGWIEWGVMAGKAKRVVIRAGQKNWTDTRFIYNYIEAKKKGIARGIYWFYDGRDSPGSQAALLKTLIEKDLPELPIFIDWEKNYGGAHEGLKNVVAMMQEVERLLPGVDIGLYTGYYWFIDNSNPIWNKAQYSYLAGKKLWLACYANADDVLVPNPWAVPYYWQWGTPAWGLEWGTETIEIDMNLDGVDTGDPDPTPIPPPDPNEETMALTLYGRNKTTLTNIRNGAGVGFTDIGDLYLNDLVEADYKDPSGIWWHLTKITRASGANFPLPGANCWAYGVNLEEYTPPAPLPSPAAGRVEVTITARVTDAEGRVYEKTIAIDEPLEAV